MNPNYNTKLGMYAKNCGINNLQMSWGHDEYLFQVLKNHGATLPSIGMYMIRFHRSVFFGARLNFNLAGKATILLFTLISLKMAKRSEAKSAKRSVASNSRFEIFFDAKLRFALLASCGQQNDHFTRKG